MEANYLYALKTAIWGLRMRQAGSLGHKIAGTIKIFQGTLELSANESVAL